ncbi:hypothetical protein BH23PLA1_BH23PLA1_31860 [soil metagenome]
MTGTGTRSGSKSDSAALACLERTRSAVLNVLVVIGIGIALSGWLLSRRDFGLALWPADVARNRALLSLIGILVASSVTRQLLSSRMALQNPFRRARRFYWAHVLGAVIGALAVPLGFAYGWAIRPRLDGVGPFWAVALAMGVLSLPRAHALEGFDQPMPLPETDRDEDTSQP